MPAWPLMHAPVLSVVVPAFRCAPDLARCLRALRASDLPHEQWELIVADDGSPDDTPAVAARLADVVVRVAGGPCGPAAARNAGAERANGDVLVFVDADVCIAPDALRRFRDQFVASPKLAAAFGAYDRTPTHASFVSQYRNLLHHYVHVTSAGAATTFWAGCGAVRATTFRAVGGFDAKRYPRPQIEDVELGYRISARGGAMVLDPAIQGTHLKRWSWRGGVVTDVRDRGVPWMHLLLERGGVIAAGPLNLRRGEKWLTVLAAAALVFTAAGVVGRSALPVAAAALALVGVLVGNAGLLRWFARVRGPAFAVAAVPLRLQYYWLNAASAVWAFGVHYSRTGRAGGGTRDARVQAVTASPVRAVPGLEAPAAASSAEPS